MRIYWFWPNPHLRPSPYAMSVTRPGDQLTVHALRSYGGQEHVPFDDYEVVRTLPDPLDGSSGARAALRPVRLPVSRVRERRRLLRRGFDVAFLGLLVRHTDWFDAPALSRRVPLVAHVHDVLPHSFRLPEIVERRMLGRVYRSVGHLVVYHQVLKEQLVAEFGVSPDQIHVLPIPFDTTDRRSSRKRDGRVPTILFFGRFRENKGIGVLADALEQVASETEARFIIAGGGEPAQEADLRRRLGGLENVELELGYVSAQRKHELLDRADWLVLPYTDFHSQSAVVIDAYQYRVPLIATDVGALGPTVRSDGSGLVLPPQDAGALAEALDRASREPTQPYAQRIDEVVKRHDVSVVGPALRSIFDVAVEGARRPSAR